MIGCATDCWVNSRQLSGESVAQNVAGVLQARRYEAPAFRVDRLAVDRTMQGRGLGGDLPLAALHSAARCGRGRDRCHLDQAAMRRVLASLSPEATARAAR